jgi:Reverse transcriptase (RNA-dependent DNA polymerase)
MDADFIRTALLTKNFFPNHRAKSPELPPFFQTTQLSDVIAAGVASTAPVAGKFKGCDYALYTLTRFNGGPRLCGIPHPYSYCRLVQAIHTHWDEIEALIDSESSQITPREHPDGRVFIMDYGSQFSKSENYLNKQVGARYVANADIANFYPSIYTHSIGWAAVGIETAKTNTNGNIWYNKIDRLVRDCKRQETNGVLIGPGTFSLVAEMILATIDKKLEKKFSFTRFIDDYCCYTKSQEEARDFIRALEIELSKFSLFLNFRKTMIKPLEGSELPPWIDELRIDSLKAPENEFYAVKLFFSRALHLSQKYPDGSVLRYAAHALCSMSFKDQTGEYILRTLLSLSLTHLHVTPCINDFIHYGRDAAGNFKYASELDALVNAAVSARRSDAMCWALYICKEVRYRPTIAASQAIIKTYDNCSMILLYEVADTPVRRSITRTVKRIILSRDASVIQRNWLLVHYLLNTKRLKPPEVSDLTLRYLAAHNINFFG